MYYLQLNQNKIIPWIEFPCGCIMTNSSKENALYIFLMDYKPLYSKFGNAQELAAIML